MLSSYPVIVYNYSLLNEKKIGRYVLLQKERKLTALCIVIAKAGILCIVDLVICCSLSWKLVCWNRYSDSVGNGPRNIALFAFFSAMSDVLRRDKRNGNLSGVVARRMDFRKFENTFRASQALNFWIIIAAGARNGQPVRETVHTEFNNAEN